jgi:Asp/Glu/hydantoin racemase
MQSCVVRIWHQSMTELDAYPVYRRALQEHVDRVAGPGCEVVLHGVAPGTYGGLPPSQVLVHPLAFHHVAGQVLDLFRQAQDERFDAVAIGSYSEPLLREARSMLDIPVASAAESTLLLGCSVARLSGLVTISAEVAWMVRRLVAEHGLADRVAGVWTIDPPLTEDQLSRAFDDPETALASVRATIGTAIAAGADVVIPAEGVISELLVAQGVTEVDGVCVMDSVGAVVLYAQLLAHLRERTGLHPGRRWHHPMPPPGMLERLAGPPQPGVGTQA